MTGVQQSTLAVVQNPVRLAPYISSLVMSLGLLIHFGLQFVGFLRRRKV